VINLPGNIVDKDKAEAEKHDREAERILSNLKFEDLIKSEKNLAQYFRPPSPSNSYQFSIHLLGDIRGKTILDLGCGPGDASVVLAKKGAKVVGIDISSKLIDIARDKSIANNISESVNSLVMSAYQLNFEDNYFDLVFGNAILHHLDLNLAVPQIYRVLKSRGKAIFNEPFANSKVFKAIRKMIPVKKDSITDNQRQLCYKELEIFKSYFKDIKLFEFQVFSRMDRVVKNKYVNYFLNVMDKKLLDNFHFLRQYARYIVIELEK
jgi:ubiquinone/menaquinone biosynthesis C-methylase UbiE